MTTSSMTWSDLAVEAPEFVEWAIATRGPLPEGLIELSLLIDLASRYYEYNKTIGRTVGKNEQVQHNSL